MPSNMGLSPNYFFASNHPGLLIRSSPIMFVASAKCYMVFVRHPFMVHMVCWSLDCCWLCWQQIRNFLICVCSWFWYGLSSPLCRWYLFLLSLVRLFHTPSSVSWVLNSTWRISDLCITFLVSRLFVASMGYFCLIHSMPQTSFITQYVSVQPMSQACWLQGKAVCHLWPPCSRSYTLSQSC